MMMAGILAGLLGSLIGAVLIGAAILLVFRLVGLTLPRFANIWKAAFFASAAVVVADGLGSALLSGPTGAIVILLLGLVGAFVAYDRVLETPDGQPMGRKVAALALGTHAVFSLAMFLLVFPVVMQAVA